MKNKFTHYLNGAVASFAIFASFFFTSQSFGQTVFKIVENSANHTILEAALKQQGLDVTLNGTTAYTLFAPDDSAFIRFLAANNLTAAQLLANTNLTNILLHHVLAGTNLSTAFVNGNVDMVSGFDANVNVASGVKIDDASVTTANITATNGVVHVINKILLTGYDDVTEVVVKSPAHTTLLQALQTANLVTTLQGTGPFTVFAPDNNAFGKFLTANNLTAAQLLANPDLANILKHHVLGLKVLSSQLVAGEVTTLNGADVTVSLTGGAFIDNAKVTSANIEARNGVVHVIDDVLVPGFDDVTEVVVRSPKHTILLQALVKANLVSELQKPGPFTVFAPDDSAFIRFLTKNNLTAAQLLANPDLSKILLNHVVAGNILSTQLTATDVTTLNTTKVRVKIAGGATINDNKVTTADIKAKNGVVHVINGILDPAFLSSSKVNKTSINIFPNPSSNVLNITGIAKGAFTIIDLTGKVALSGSLQGSTIAINKLNVGAYVLNVTDNGQVFTAKFSKN